MVTSAGQSLLGGLQAREHQERRFTTVVRELFAKVNALGVISVLSRGY